MVQSENILLTKKHILILGKYKNLNIDSEYVKELEYIKKNFCGLVICNFESINQISKHLRDDTILYLCGNIEEICTIIHPKQYFIVREFSYQYDPCNLNIIDTGKLPINMCNMGIYFRKLFNEENLFESIHNEHKFQSLTESNKEGRAL